MSRSRAARLSLPAQNQQEGRAGLMRRQQKSCAIVVNVANNEIIRTEVSKRSPVTQRPALQEHRVPLLELFRLVEGQAIAGEQIDHLEMIAIIEAAADQSHDVAGLDGLDHRQPGNSLGW